MEVRIKLLWNAAAVAAALNKGICWLAATTMTLIVIVGKCLGSCLLDHGKAGGCFFLQMLTDAF